MKVQRVQLMKKGKGYRMLSLLMMFVMIFSITAQPASALSSYATNDAPTKAKWDSTKDFVELNLYDYSGKINDKWRSNSKYPGFQWNGGAYENDKYTITKVDYIDFGNSKITDYDYQSSNHGESNTATSVVKTASGYANNINYIDVSSYGVTNRPAGMSLGNEILSRQLINGYPALKDGTSLDYLFKAGSAVTKKNTESVDGLFQKDEATGAYSYNSRENHAEYANNRFTLYDQIITPNFIVYPFGNFLPFNKITSSDSSTQVSKITNMKNYVNAVRGKLSDSDSTDKQLKYMLNRYNSNIGSNWSSASAIESYFKGGEVKTSDIGFIKPDHLKNIYNIDWNIDTNFFFGMEMKMQFVQPKDGKTGNDGKQPMVFYFTGDDDVWVYVDGTLFLDLTGIHRHVGGKIDFEKGIVYYYPLSVQTGDVSTTPYKTYTFEELLRAAGKDNATIANVLKTENGKYTAFKDHTEHSFNFYYMERGSGSSVCRMNFNFPLLKQNSISVEKEVTGNENLMGEASYDFQLLKADENGKKSETLFVPAGTEYKVYDKKGNRLYSDKKLTTDKNGVFSLKAGERAEFEGIKENAGKFYVRELFDADDVAQYGNVTVDGVNATSGQVTIDQKTFATRESAVKNASDGAAIFDFENQVSKNSGTLTISKEATSKYTSEKQLKEREFTFEVTVSGKKLPKNTEYKVGNATKKVEEAGIIKLKAGETATISKLLAESTFTVKELTSDYDVKYKLDGKDVDKGEVSGTIKVSSTEKDSVVTVTANNTEKGDSIEIPVTKTLLNSDGSDYTYTFKLQKKTSEGKWTDVDSKTVTFGKDDESDSATKRTAFRLNYAAGDSALDLGKHTYRVIEVAEPDYENIEFDTAKHEFEVTVTKTNGNVDAKVSGDEQDKDQVNTEFTNKVLYALPETGGMGTTGMYLAGLLLVLGAAFALVRKYRKAC